MVSEAGPWYVRYTHEVVRSISVCIHRFYVRHNIAGGVGGQILFSPTNQIFFYMYIFASTLPLKDASL